MKTNGKIQLFPLLRIAAFLAFGIFLGYEWRGLISLDIALACFVAAVVVILIFRRHDVLQGVAICFASLFLGAVIICRHLQQIGIPLPKGDVTYKGVVASVPQERGKVLRFDLWIVDGDSTVRRVKASLLKDTLTRQYLHLNVGDGLVATSKLERPAKFGRSSFDYPLYLRCHGFTATTLILPDSWKKTVVSLKRLSHLDRTKLAAMRFRQATLQRYFSDGLDDEEMAVAVAMALGDKSRLTNDLRDVYSISGASHVLALSGLHLGIIYILLSLIVGSRRLGVVRELLIILGIWSYAVFTGLSPSVVRASVMITIYAVIGVMRRDRMSLNALALTAIIMLFANPLCLYDVGFQMSFLAVFFILVYYKPVYGLVSSSFLMRHPVLKWVWAMVVVSCCAQLGVAPLTAYYFGRFSCYFLLTNFVVIPLATVILYLAAAMMMASLWPSLLSWMAKVLSVVVGLQTTMVRWVSSLPEASIEGITINRVQLLLVYVIIMAFSVVAYYFTRGVRRRASF